MAKKGWLVYGIISICILFIFVLIRKNKVIEGFSITANYELTFYPEMSYAAPYTMAIDNNNNIYFTTFSNTWIYRYNIDTKIVTGYFNTNMTQNTYLKIDSSNNLYINISNYTAGTPLSSKCYKITNSSGSLTMTQYPNNTTFTNRNIVIDSVGNIYTYRGVTETGNTPTVNIIKITSSGIQSTYTSISNEAFDLHVHMAFDSLGNLFIANNGYGRIHKITPSFVRTSYTFNQTTNKSGEFGGITIDSSNNIYVISRSERYVYMFNNNITTITKIIGCGNASGSATINIQNGVTCSASSSVATGTTKGILWPNAITIASNGVLYVSSRKSTRTADDNKSYIGIITIACLTTQYNKEGVCTTLPDNSVINTAKDGYNCKPNYYNNGTACITCPAGSFCPANTTTPNPCPAGSYCAAGVSAATQCLAGTYCAAGTSSPTQCPAGSYCGAGATAPIACGANQYSSVGSSSCTTCTVSPGSATMIASGGSCIAGTCQPGYILNGNSCSQCPAGTVSSGGTATSCASCGPGQYSASATSCSTCSRSAGATAMTSPANSISQSSCYPSECDSTHYLLNNSCVRVPDNADKNPSGGFTCQTGFYISGTSCARPPDGGVINGGGDGFICNPGYSVSTDGASCTKCAAGYYNAVAGGTCARCETGKYSGEGATSCSLPPENATVNTDSTGFLCAIGYEQGTSSCSECGVGSYNDVAGSTCKRCSSEGAISVTSPVKASNASQCIVTACQTGYYISGSQCVRLRDGEVINPGGDGYTCATGYYSNAAGDCLQLPENSTPNPTGGFTCLAGYEQGTTSCTQCGAGKYNDVPGSTCKNCSSEGASSMTSPIKASNASQCYATACQTGYYISQTGCIRLRDGEVINPTNDGYTCATGYYSNIGGGCLSLPEGGSYVPGGGFECQAGYGQGATTCTQCGAGTYNDVPGSLCKECSSEGASSISSPVKASNASQCYATACQTGYYISQTGCIRLRDGEVINPTGDGYTCATGYYSNVGGGCLPLPEGGSYVPGGGFECQAGYGQGTTTCTQCGAGTYNDVPGSICKECLRTDGSTSMTSQAKATSASQCASSSCQPGYGFSSGNCTQCGAGFFGTGGTTMCVQCQAGYVSAAGSSSCQPCTNTTLPPKSQGSTNGILAAIQTCVSGGTNIYNYIIGGTTTTTNPCTGQSYYDFDQKACVDAVGTSVDSSSPVCSSDTVYSQETNACVPVRVIVKPGDPQLTGTGGEPGSGDYENCKTVDQGDCTLRFKNGDTTTTTNPCIASGKIYNFSTKTCVPPTNPCCKFNDAAVAAANGCLANTQLVSRKNPQKCPTNSKDLCCNQASSTNSTCEKRGYWSKGYVFTSNHRAACASGFKDYGNGIDTIQQKRAKRLKV